MFQKRLEFFRSILYGGDLCLVAACWLAAYFIRFYTPIIPVTKGVPDLTLYLTLMGLVLVVYAVALPATGLYRRPWAGPGQYAWPLLRATTFGAVVCVTVTYFFKPYEFSRLVFLHFFVLINLVLFIYRPTLMRLWLRLFPERVGEGVLIVGAEEVGRLVAKKVGQQPILGLRLEGFLCKDPQMVGQDLDSLPILGHFAQIKQILDRYPIQVVIIALPLSAHDRIMDIITNIGDEMVDIKVVPDLFKFMSLRGSVEEFEGLPIIGLRGSPMVGWSRVIKRLTDIFGSFFLLLLLSPVFLILAIAVKLSSPGPVFYRQKRMGLDGRVFTMLKFRSMRVDAEKKSGPVWASKNDPRRTGLGSFMRRTSLDELPQFFNVLKGQMSLVGPRPERPELIKDFKTKVPGYMLRHKMKAGITGWAQINGWRGNTSLEKRIEHDLYYIENWSLSLDLKIIMLTILRGFMNPHAY